MEGLLKAEIAHRGGPRLLLGVGLLLPVASRCRAWESACWDSEAVPYPHFLRLAKPQFSYL